MLFKVIAEYNILDYTHQLIFHGTGNLEEDIARSVSGKSQYGFIVVGEIFARYQERLTTATELITLINRLEKALVDMHELPEILYLDIIRILGVRILQTKTLVLDDSLADLIKKYYTTAKTRDDAFLSWYIDDYFGGHQQVEKLFKQACSPEAAISSS